MGCRRSLFGEWRFWYLKSTFDLYFAGVRAGANFAGEIPTDKGQTWRPMRRLLPLPHRAVRLPLRVVAALVHDEDRYQRLVMPYWLMLLRRSRGHQRAARNATP